MRRTNRLGLLAATGLAALALTATACDSGGSDYGGSDRSDTPAKDTGQQPSPAAGGADLAAAESPRLGSIVTDAEGRTLYRFGQDTADPSVSNCKDDCAAKWPPALAGGRATLKGVDKNLVSTVTRADGGKQLTLAGWPLYRFAQDAKPGDAKGQGVGGTWFASTPEGKKAQAGAAGAEDKQGSDGADGGENGDGSGSDEYGY
ncbi:hypothetical protein [Streptomyces sp. H27-D2]|uniref:hypothetical protein n=1 Tax=Streptomyces sp. H27-D2 TaxID=3046304 RepID=UPI002DB5C00C|nr:hypothetical protein [Streptomyces sp. H27-D2]MEC4015086.1 hypothetical protein [Streptomyces sp. H27-D2]